jgi:hypothetical protein
MAKIPRHSRVDPLATAPALDHPGLDLKSPPPAQPLMITAIAPR